MWVNPIFRGLFWEMSLFCDLRLVLNSETLFGNIRTFTVAFSPLPFQPLVWHCCQVRLHLPQILPGNIPLRVESIIETRANEAFLGFPVCITSVRTSAKRRIGKLVLLLRERSSLNDFSLLPRAS